MRVNFRELNPPEGFLGRFSECGKRLFWRRATVRSAVDRQPAKSLAISSLPHFADCGGANCGTVACLSASVASLPFRGVSNCGRHLDKNAENPHPCRIKKIRHGGRTIKIPTVTARELNSRRFNHLGVIS
jgi:hypothetical protein